MRRTTLLAGIALALPVAFAAARADEGEKLDRAMHTWRRWKVGTRITLAVGVTVDGAPVPQASQNMQLSLAAASEEAIDIAREVFDTTGAKKAEAKIHEVAKRIGEEDVKVGEESKACVKWEVVSTEGERGETNTMWVADGAPGALRYDTRSYDGTGFSATAVKIGEEVTVGAGTFECVRLEGALIVPPDSPMAAAKPTITVWMSDEVPGGMVKFELRATNQGKKIVRTLAIEKIEGEKAE